MAVFSSSGIEVQAARKLSAHADESNLTITNMPIPSLVNFLQIHSWSS